MLLLANLPTVRIRASFSRDAFQEMETSTGQLPDPTKLHITPPVKRQFSLKIKGTELTFLSTTKDI